MARTKKSDDRLLAALLQGRSISDAASLADMSRRTASRRMADEDFRRRLKDARAQVVHEVGRKLTAAATVAADETLKLMKESESEAIRLGAARLIFENELRIRESVDMGERLDKLEKAIERTH